MNPLNSSSFLKPIIDLGSLAPDQLEDQVASSREISISLPKNKSPNASSPTNSLELNVPSLSNPDSRNIPIDRSESFPLATSKGLIIKVKTVTDAPIINPEPTFTTTLLPLKSNLLFSTSEVPTPKNHHNQEHEHHECHHENHEIDAEGFPMFDPQQLQQATPQGPTTVTAVTNLSNTFLLHSNPFATKTIYLDFNGHILPANTGWTSSYNGGSAINAPAWSMDANNTTFSDAELTRIQAIWQRVAEDFAPFDVDVTTNFRGEDYLTRSSSSDQVYGIRALISPIGSYFGGGGIAYIDVFDDVGDNYKPALIFPENLGPNSEKSVAEAISHEVGHTLGLGHDGNATQDYYSGHSSGATGWAPIMGIAYNRSLSQWSKGEYSGANQPQDDLSIITTNNGFGYRSDDAGNNALTLNDLGLLGQNALNSGLMDVSQFGIIERTSDQDWFRFTTGSGAINLTIQSITKAWINNGGSFGAEYLTQPSGATNLDIWAGIYGSNGTTLIAQSNPTDLLSANFSNLFLNAGTYYLAIDGVGKGDLITGYSDYGSLGQYAITGTIIGNGMTVTPIAGLTTTEAGGTTTFTVVLNTAPTANVVITLNSSNTNEGTINKSTLTFTTANWNIAQQVTVTGVDDAINDGDQNYSIILNPASSTDANYNGIDPRDVSLVNINNDLPVLNITTSPQVIVEGLSSPQSIVYTVSLTGIVNNSQTVTVQYATSNGSAISSSDYTSTTGTLTFTGGVTSQNITIPIINNALNEADETFILTLSNPTQATLGNTASVTTTITDTLVTDVTTSLASGVENLTLIGVNAINGTGNSSNNILIGNSFNNILNGSTGIDNLIGGMGDDIYVVDTTTDVITENAGEGTDTIQSSVTFAMTALTNIENLTLTGSSAINGTGNTGNNALTGNNANNILNGAAGIDVLNGAGGIDTLIGGMGDDIYIVDTTTDIITENAGEGTDTIQSSVTFSLAALTHIENLTLTGTSAINGTGNAANNIITGNIGNNILNGGDGIDTLIGGVGNDIYIVDTTTDGITENAGEGTDTIQSSVTFSLSPLINIENLTLIGINAINGTGNAMNNIITGNTADNILTGGDGIDTLIGGTGNDSYVVDTTTDVIIEASASGTDTVQSSVTFSISSLTNIENLTLTGSNVINGTGNTGNNTITGNIANNTFNGGSGIDTLIGSTGDDIYIVDTTTDIITENAGEGIDTIQSSVTFSLAALTHIENLTLTGTSAINGTGNAANNIITGNIGNNILNGGDGIDTLIGGVGNDIYIVDTTTDGITENAGEGTDTIQSSVTFSLSPLINIENLTLIGTSAINGTGNAMNNIITGNTADNILTGGDGIDTLIGGTGNDSYVVDTTTDVITENAASGTDTVQSSVTFSISSLTNVENLTLTGSNAINGTGNAGSNTIIGNMTDNLLTGGGGSDTLTGGLGVDRFSYTTLGDSLLGSTNNSFDVITDFNANAGNDLFLVSTARSGLIDVGAIATLDAAGIGAVLTTTAFKANYAAQFTFTSGSTTRTFMSINNGSAGFSATVDAIVEITGLTGTIVLGNFTTV